MTFIFPFRDLEVEVKVNLHRLVGSIHNRYFEDCEVVSVNWPDRLAYVGEGEKRERVVIHAEQQTDMNDDPVELPTIKEITADWDTFMNAVNEAANNQSGGR